MGSGDASSLPEPISYQVVESMMFRRKKRKPREDSNQLLLFSLEEMRGDKESPAQVISTPSSPEPNDAPQPPSTSIFPDVRSADVRSADVPLPSTSETAEGKDTVAESSPHVSGNENVASDAEESIPQVADNRYSADHHQLLESMRKAIRQLSSINNNGIRLIAIECASHAQAGINTEHTYCLRALNDKIVSGYDFIAIYYVSFAHSFPSMLEKIDLPFSDIYEEALSLGI